MVRILGTRYFTKRKAALNIIPNIAIIGSIMIAIIRVAGVCLSLMSSDCVKYIDVLMEQCADIILRKNVLENVLKH